MNVAIVGTGYVGLVTGACLAHVGHRVQCVDVNAERVAQIQRGESPIHEPGLTELLRNERFSATTDLRAAVRESEIIMIAVGTPLAGGEIDLQYVQRAAHQIGEVIRDGQVVVVKSTVVPSTTDTFISRWLGRPIGLTVNPEFLQEGSAVENFLHPDRIVIGGNDAHAIELTAQLYSSFDCPIIKTTSRNAELIKYTSNAVLATLISFSNEIASICEQLPGLDVEAVMDGVHLDRRWSSRGILSYLRAGSGFGGSCLPKDVGALAGFAASHAIATPLLDAVMRINEQRPRTLIARAGDLRDRKVALLGLAFKPNTDDTRDSPALKLLDELLARGANVHAFDPVAKLPEQYANRVTTAPSLAEAVSQAHAAILATAWPEFASADWPDLLARMAQPVVIDGRNALRNVAWPPGARYLSVGHHA